MTLDWNGHIVVTRCLNENTYWLSELEGAQQIDQFNILVPPSRVNFMAVEASSVINSMTEAYIEARKEYMSFPKESLEETKRLLSESGISPEKLLNHQIDTITFARTRPGTFIASEQGTGKTRTVLSLIGIWAPIFTLVVAPKSVIREWPLEAEKIGLPFEVIPLDRGTVSQRAKKIIDHPDLKTKPIVAVTNYEALRSLLRELHKAKIYPTCLVGDESWKIKNRSSQVSKAFYAFSKAATYKILLSGTPIGNDVGDLWSQIRCIDEGIFPAKYKDYMEYFCEFTNVNFNGYVTRKPIGVKNSSRLMRDIERIWFRVTKGSCLDLPAKIKRTVRLEMPELTRRWYDAVTEHGEQALGKELSLSGDRTTLIRLQQITGGHIVLFEGESLFEKVEKEYSLPCAKIQWIVDWVRGHLEGDRTVRAIIWCRFNNEVFRISQILSDMLGPGSVSPVWGPVDDTVLLAIKDSFNSRSPDGVRIIVAQTSKIAYGHNLQGADFSIYYNHSWSYVERAQSEDRSHRMGRMTPVTYINLVYKDSIDESVIRAQKRKTDLAEKIAVLTV